MLLIFPFEEDIYKKYGIPAVFVGHPLANKVDVSMTREDFFHKHGINSEKTIVCLLPGSRSSEIGYHMPVLIEALKKINQKYDVQFILNLAKNLDKNLVLKYIPSGLNNILALTDEDAYDAMAYSDLALSSCGNSHRPSTSIGPAVCCPGGAPKIGKLIPRRSSGPTCVPVTYSQLSAHLTPDTPSAAASITCGRTGPLK